MYLSPHAHGNRSNVCLTQQTTAKQSRSSINSSLIGFCEKKENKEKKKKTFSSYGSLLLGDVILWHQFMMRKIQERRNLKAYFTARPDDDV